MGLARETVQFPMVINSSKLLKWLMFSKVFSSNISVESPHLQNTVYATLSVISSINSALTASMGAS